MYRWWYSTCKGFPIRHGGELRASLELLMDPMKFKRPIATLLNMNANNIIQKYV